MPFIQHEYRATPDPRVTGIGGSSLGGLVSLYFGLKLPHTFGKIAALSPSVWWQQSMIMKFAEGTTFGGPTTATLPKRRSIFRLRSSVPVQSGPHPQSGSTSAPKKARASSPKLNNSATSCSAKAGAKAKTCTTSESKAENTTNLPGPTIGRVLQFLYPAQPGPNCLFGPMRITRVRRR